MRVITLNALQCVLEALVHKLGVGCKADTPRRRSAYGMLEALVANGVRLDLPRALAAAADLQAVATPPEARASVLEFVTRRLEQLLVDGGCAVEAVRAALAERGADPALAAATARELQVTTLLMRLPNTCSLVDLPDAADGWRAFEKLGCTYQFLPLACCSSDGCTGEGGFPGPVPCCHGKGWWLRRRRWMRGRRGGCRA